MRAAERRVYERETAPYVSDDFVTFFLQAPDARTVSVAGSFNEWKGETNPMRRDGRDGWWVSEPVRVAAPNRHLYRFLINGERFMDDPLNFNKTQNKHGPAAYFDTWMDIPGVDAQLAGIHEALLKNPPGTGNPWIRDMCTTFLDDYLQQPNVNRSSTVREFFIRRVRNALDEIERTAVKDGVRMWHIYNHGYVFKTPEAVFAVDVVTTRHIWNLAWDVPADISDRIARLLDGMLITHEHSDHADFEIIGKLLAARKAVVVPEASIHKFPKGCFSVDAWGHKEVRGQKVMARPGVHVYDQGRNVQNVVYEIVTDSGVHILHTGDHDYTEGLSWHRPPDILIPKFDGVSPKYPNEKVLEILFAYGNPGLIIPGHINELAHYPGGGRTSLRDAARQFQLCKVPYQIMLWGESYRFS